MSTSETVTFTANACPCGKGSILKHVTSQDNPWSSVDVSYELDCKSCASKWRMDYSGLVRVDSEAPYNAARDAHSKASKALRKVSATLVDGYFSAGQHRTKKAQWEAMRELKIYGDSYRNYLKRRSEGETPGEIALPLGNVSWLLSLAEKENRLDETKSVLSEHEAAADAWNDAAKKIVRWPKDAK